MKQRGARQAASAGVRGSLWLLLLVGACSSARVPSGPSAIAPGAPSGAPPNAAPAASTRLSDQQRTSAERAPGGVPDQLAAPAALFLAHEQAAPRGFRDFGTKPWSATWAHAKMFAFGFADPAFGSCNERVVNHDGTICTGAVYPGVELTAAQGARVAALAREASERSAGPSQVRCFDPHHAIVFYDARDVPVAELTVCFECGNLRVSPGSSGPAALSAIELRDLADLCSSRQVGGCPALQDNGEVRAAEFPRPSLPPDRQQAWRVQRALERDHGLAANERLDALTAHERLRLCAWLDSASRLTGRHLECRDGRHLEARAIDECSAAPAASCAATVDDFARCLKSRLAPLCGQDAPSCTASDACGWGFLLVDKTE